MFTAGDQPIFDNLVMNLSAEFKSVRDRSYKKMADRCGVLPSATEQIGQTSVLSCSWPSFALVKGVQSI
jgi:hypothetical protein